MADHPTHRLLGLPDDLAGHPGRDVLVLSGIAHQTFSSPASLIRSTHRCERRKGTNVTDRRPGGNKAPAWILWIARVFPVRHFAVSLQAGFLGTLPLGRRGGRLGLGGFGALAAAR